MAKQILDFDEMYDDLSNETPKNFGRKKRTPKTSAEIAASRFDKDKHKSVSDKLLYDANSKLNYYLKKSPHYQVIQKQIEILTEESKLYQKNGNLESYNESKNIILELKEKLKNLRTIFKTGQSLNKEKSKQINDELNSSTELRDLRRLRKDLAKQIKLNTPSHIIKTIQTFRKSLALVDKVYEKESTKDDILNSVVEFDDFADEISIINSEYLEDEQINYDNLNQLEQEYYDYCGIIADISGLTVNELVTEKIANLKSILDGLLNPEPLKEEYIKIGGKIESTKARITGQTQLTDLIYDTFDFTNDLEDSHIPKEILASTNIPLVRVIANKICLSLGLMNYYDDAVSAGLVGLTLAINNWYNTQKKLNGSPLSFKGFAPIYISTTINRELYSLSSKGKINGSVLATLKHKQKNKLNNFIKANPEFDGVDKSFLSELLSNYDDDFKNNVDRDDTVAETDYTSVVTGEESEASDVWANAAVDDSESQDILVEAQIEYKKLFKSIMDLFEIFNVKKNKQGLSVVSDKKAFDIYDRQLFLLKFGLVHKIEKHNIENLRNGTNPGDFNSVEIAEELTYFAQNEVGDLNKTFTPEAVFARYKRMIEKINLAFEVNPTLKAGFEYIYKYWSDKQEILKKLSNSREEIGMSTTRESLKNAYLNIDDDSIDLDSILSTQLSDGTLLSDSIDTSDNIFDDDDFFNNFNNNFLNK